MTSPAIPTAAILIVGNEILSGRTQDTNSHFLAKGLSVLGINLQRIMVIGDVHVRIVEEVLALSQAFDYLFVTGGIGPTHDDITSVAVAEAMGVPLVRHPAAVKALTDYYTAIEKPLNAARLKMADVPEGAILIANPISAAPGYQLANVFVLAGVPRVMHAMWAFVATQLKPGTPAISMALDIDVAEGEIAEQYTVLQARYPMVVMGSYPYEIVGGGYGTSLVLRGWDAVQVQEAFAELQTLMKDYL
jgi:molybdenum cofactor synthesis domain-containing protein